MDEENNKENKNRIKRLERIDKKIDYIEQRIESLMEGVNDDDLAPAERMDIAIKLLGKYMSLEQLRRGDELEFNDNNAIGERLLQLFLRGESIDVKRLKDGT